MPTGCGMAGGIRRMDRGDAFRLTCVRRRAMMAGLCEQHGDYQQRNWTICQDVTGQSSECLGRVADAGDGWTFVRNHETYRQPEPD